MKFSVECQVESKMILDGKIEIEQESRKYVFYPDNKGMLAKIKIISEVEHPEKFYSEIKHTPNEKTKYHFIVNEDKELYDSLIRDFQELESILAFGGNLKKISWNRVKYELICETEEEIEKTKIVSTFFKEEYPDIPKRLDEEILKDIISTKEKYVSLTIPKAFWREGNNDFKSFRYINAFFNFYFILEGLYGNGKTKNYAVMKEFGKSEEFRKIVEWIINNLKRTPKHLKKIEEMLRYRQKNLDIEGIIHLVVSTRGDLHHFASNSSGIQGTPFNQKEFKSIAFVSFGLATRVITQKILEINQNS